MDEPYTPICGNIPYPKDCEGKSAVIHFGIEDVKPGSLTQKF